jgi:hypothetical protein
MDIVTGEKIQELADRYVGFERDFGCNPRIAMQRNKQLQFNDLINIRSYSNDTVIFCYGHNIDNFATVVNTFTNPFILITHNSDQNVENSPAVNHILNQTKLVRWYAQNVNYRHLKLYFLPIGIANSMWPHGNLSALWDCIENKPTEKTAEIYMHFEMSTNYYKRYPCFVALSGKIEFLPKMDPHSNLIRMAKYKYCICPEGNGLDTHRLWEAYYLRVVPILLRSVHTEILREQSGLPMILVDSWESLDIDKLPPYESFDFDTGVHYLTMDSTFYKNIRDIL